MIAGPDQTGFLVIDQETLDHLPAFHKAIAEVLIERGRWQLADSENKESGDARAKAFPSDIQRATYASSLIDVPV